MEIVNSFQKAKSYAEEYAIQVRYEDGSGEQLRFLREHRIPTGSSESEGSVRWYYRTTDKVQLNGQFRDLDRWNRVIDPQLVVALETAR